jgi:hypothetical protein
MESWSYVGTGCVECNVECQLSRAGPATLANGTLGSGPEAFRAPVTAMPGDKRLLVGLHGLVSLQHDQRTKCMQSMPHLNLK